MSDGLRYQVELPTPHDHLAHITVTVPVPAGADAIELWMPAWCPGSYLIRDYARLIRDLVATADGRPTTAHKVDKTTWRIACAGARTVAVRYTIYGNELTVRTNHIDATHAFLHGPATFLTGDAWRHAPCEVRFVAPPGWTVATSLEAKDGAYVAADADELYDAPFHLAAPGAVTRHAFSSAGVPYLLELWGERAPGGAFSVEQLVADLTKIADGHAARMGEVPFPRYVFVVMFTHDGYGGLEHRGSSINLHNTYALATRKHYEGLLELLSHELFHAWNGKRLAPAPLLRFDYGREAYTRCLWVMEGLTSHYDRFNLRTAGVITGKAYLEKLVDDWTRLQAVPGRRRHSLEASSFDAWIKLYKPDESNLNTTVSYYLKGGLVAQAMDLEIRRRTAEARSLDDVLRTLWQRFGARGEPHPEDVEAIFAEAAGVELSAAFEQLVRGTEDPDLVGELAQVGLTLRPAHEVGQVADGAVPTWLGVTTSGTRVTGVFDDGPAAAAGVSPGDELVAIDGLRATALDDARALVAARKPGDVASLTLFRRHRLVQTSVAIGAAPPTRWELVGVTGDAGAARYRAWLGEDHPGAATVCAVNVGNRWL